MSKIIYQVEVTEHERGWNPSSWVNEYESFEEAQSFMSEINSGNNKPFVPDIYYQAHYLGTKLVEENNA